MWPTTLNDLAVNYFYNHIDLIVSGSFGSGTHNPYTSTAFIAKVDQNGKLINLKIMYYSYYGYSFYNAKWAEYSGAYFIWQLIGSGAILITKMDYNYQSETSCYNTLLSGSSDLLSFHYNTYSGWLTQSDKKIFVRSKIFLI